MDWGGLGWTNVANYPPATCHLVLKFTSIGSGTVLVLLRLDIAALVLSCSSPCSMLIQIQVLRSSMQGRLVQADLGQATTIAHHIPCIQSELWSYERVGPKPGILGHLSWLTYFFSSKNGRSHAVVVQGAGCRRSAYKMKPRLPDDSILQLDAVGATSQARGQESGPFLLAVEHYTAAR